MEALVALGLAGNVVQFVDFATKLIRTSNELRHDAASAENRDHAVIATHLEGLAKDIGLRAQAIAQTSSTASAEDKAGFHCALQAVAEGCYALAQQLLRRLEACGIKHDQNVSLASRTRRAFKCMWNKREIQDITSRLGHFRSEIHLHLTRQIQQSQIADHGLWPTKNDLVSILDRVNCLKSEIQSLASETSVKDDNRQRELVDNLAQLRIETAQAHAQSEQSISYIAQATSGINMRSECRHREVVDSLADIKVVNGQMITKATQVLSSALNARASFEHVLRSSLEEYQEEFLAGVRKEIRGTARAEVERMLPAILDALREMQDRTAGNHERDETRIDLDSSSVEEDDILKPEMTSMDLRSSTQPDENDFHIPAKRDFALAYTRDWETSTRLGRFLLRIRHKTVFEQARPATDIFELTAHLIPSPSWLSRGCSLTFQKMTDSRGGPRFLLQPQTYRVLSDEHEAIIAVEEGDIETVRSMLCQKTMFPSDRDYLGQSLLHIAVWHGHLDVCKTLVASGADINAQFSLLFSSLSFSILPRCLFGNKQGQDIFYYLQGLSGIDMEPIWQNLCLVFWSIMDLFNFYGEEARLTNVDDAIFGWSSICKSISFDFNVQGEDRFYLLLVLYISQWDVTLSDTVMSHFIRYRHEEISGKRNYSQLLDYLINIFDSIIRQRIGSTAAPSLDIPVAYAAWLIDLYLCMAQQHSLIAQNPSTTLCMPYRGYYIGRDLELSLRFLEHVISLGISYRPDCIFDTEFETAIYDTFLDDGWEDIWKQILEEHGIDPNWALEESERRKRVVLGDSSAHEVRVGVNASEVLQVQRRRVFEADGD